MLLLSYWLNRIFQQYLSTGEWNKRKGEIMSWCPLYCDDNILSNRILQNVKSLSKKLAGLLVNTNSNSLNYNSHFTKTFILLRLLCQWWNSFTIARIISLPFINFVFCLLADCHATDSSKISQRGCWLPPIYLAVEWTSKESTLFSITTCQRTLTPTFTGFVNSFHSFWKGVSFSVVSTSIETCFVMGK